MFKCFCGNLTNNSDGHGLLRGSKVESNYDCINIYICTMYIMYIWWFIIIMYSMMSNPLYKRARHLVSQVASHWASDFWILLAWSKTLLSSSGIWGSTFNLLILHWHWQHEAKELLQKIHKGLLSQWIRKNCLYNQKWMWTIMPSAWHFKT